MRGCSIVWFRRNGEIGCKRLSKSLHFNGGSRGRKDSWHVVYGTLIILFGSFPSLVWHVTASGTPGEDGFFKFDISCVERRDVSWWRTLFSCWSIKMGSFVDFLGRNIWVRKWKYA